MIIRHQRCFRNASFFPSTNGFEGNSLQRCQRAASVDWQFFFILGRRSVRLPVERTFLAFSLTVLSYVQVWEFHPTKIRTSSTLIGGNNETSLVLILRLVLHFTFLRLFLTFCLLFWPKCGLSKGQKSKNTFLTSPSGRGLRIEAEEPGHGKLVSLVLDMCKGMYSSGRVVNMDNYYTSPEVAIALAKKEVYIRGKPFSAPFVFIFAGVKLFSWISAWFLCSYCYVCSKSVK